MIFVNLLAVGICILLNYLCLAENCAGFETAPSEFDGISPHLQLSPHHGIVKTNKYILINTTRVLEVRLDCWASYPIDLTFSGHLTNQRAEVRTKVSKYIKANGETGHCYHINVSLTTLKEITGNYSCFSVSNVNLVNSTYIYAYSPPPGVFLRSGESVTVVVKRGQKSVILPCAVSNPESQAQLQKLSLGNDEKWVWKSNDLKFDPKVGYEMALSDPHDVQLGEYQCQIPPAEENVVTIKLVKEKDWSIHPKANRVDIKKGERLVLKCKSETEVEFESTPEFPLDVEMNATESMDSNRYKFEKVFYTQVLNESVIGNVKCVKKASKITLHQWTIHVRNGTRELGVLDTRPIVNSCPNPVNSTWKNDNSIVLFECGNWVECRLNKCLRDDKTCQPNNQCVKKLCMKNGIIQCPTSDGAVSEIYFTGFNGKKYTNWKYAEEKDILKIESQVVKDSFKNTFLNVICEGTNFVVSGGFQWSIVYENGSSIDVPNGNSKYLIKENWGRGKSTVVSTLRLPVVDRTTPLEIKGVLCSAPIWNTTEWINQTIHKHDMILLISRSLDENEATSSARIMVPFLTWLVFISSWPLLL